jgi:glycosyltransferase involved in cell wall biosynthesis
MNEIDVSVVLPVFNAEESLRGCIDSLLTQTGVRLEIIAVYRPSSDSTLEIIQSYGGSLRLIYSDEPGVYSAMNRGLMEARGRWMYFIGADDRLVSPDVFARAIAYSEDKIDLLTGAIRYIRRSHFLVPKAHESKFGSGLRWRNTLHHQGCLYRRKLFEQRLFDINYKILADYDLNLFLWKSGYRAVDTGILMAECAAEGLSKQFGRALYREELLLKQKRLSTWEYALNVIWVRLKWLVKGYGHG